MGKTNKLAVHMRPYVRTSCVESFASFARVDFFFSIATAKKNWLQPEVCSVQKHQGIQQYHVVMPVRRFVVLDPAIKRKGDQNRMRLIPSFQSKGDEVFRS